MPRKQKITVAEKIRIVEQHELGELSIGEAARICGVNKESVRSWIAQYRSEGTCGLEQQFQNRMYTPDLKQQAVEAYLSGKGSIQKICEIFKIRSTAQLRNWLKVYNSGNDFTNKMSGGSRMKSTRKTTQEERIQIAKECIESENNYGLIAKKYGASYQQTRTWTLKYRELGDAGLEDRHCSTTAANRRRDSAHTSSTIGTPTLFGGDGEQCPKKIAGNRKERCLGQVRQLRQYRTIQECEKEYGYPVGCVCKILGVSRAAYYRWASGKTSRRAAKNEELAGKIETIHAESPDKGYRRIRDDLQHDHGIHVNDKRVLRICRLEGIKSTIKYQNNGCTRHAKNPQYIAENLLNRDFHASMPNEKWLTDVTEFKWYEGSVVHKVYLSAILDLYDRRIVTFVVSERNDNPLVFKTLDRAIAANPDAHPLFHSDRGFQYTNRTFHHKLENAGMVQSMSRVAHCIDNGPMEGFWGILKRERYYGKRFTSKQELISMIHSYISYYNSRRVQRNLGVLTPLEKHNLVSAA